jgi:hypothetical protein
MNLITHLRSFFNTPTLFKVEQVQALWSGYGEIARYHIQQNSDVGVEKSIIVKHVELPDKSSHPRGWNTNASHQRKISSYINEERFYARYAHLCDTHCYVPKHLGSLNLSEPKPIILEDLDALGFSQRFGSASLNQAILGIRWLAYFHACYVDKVTDDLWSVGTYWHLATRLEELAAMADGELKHLANAIDAQLNDASYQTLLHGDAKIANFCWHRDGNNLAAIDFQYVGKGIGVKDLMYFLGSCLTTKQLLNHGSELLKTYFKLFHEALNYYGKSIDGVAIEQQWRKLYPLAWADFHRFLLGWHPKHIKINAYMQQQTGMALALIHASK